MGKRPVGINLERVTSLGVVEKRIMLLLLQHESLTFSDLTASDATVGHQPAVAKALNTLEALNYTSAPPRRGRRRRPHKLTDRGFLAAMILPEVWKLEMLEHIFETHPNRFTWFERFGYLKSRDILEGILMKFRFVLEKYDVYKFVTGKVTSSFPDPEPDYPEIFNNYPVIDEFPKNILDDVTALTFWVSDFREMEKLRAYDLHKVINIFLDDPKLRSIMTKLLRDELTKTENEFERLTWWVGYVKKHTESKREERYTLRSDMS